MSDSIVVTRSAYASVAHRYWREDWSGEKNSAVYGRDASRQGLGSNLRLDLAVATENDDLDDRFLSDALARLKARIDHRCLFLEGEFGSQPSTLENITSGLAQNLLAEKPASGRWFALTVWETEHLSCRKILYPEYGEQYSGYRMLFKRRNLSLLFKGDVERESGLAVPRAAVAEAVEQCLVKLNAFHAGDLKEWGRRLGLELRASLPKLQGLKIDLGRHKALVVHF